MGVGAARGEDDLLVRGRRQLVLEDEQVQVAALKFGRARQVAVSLAFQQLEQVEPDPQPGACPPAWPASRPSGSPSTYRLAGESGDRSDSTQRGNTR